MPRNLAKYLRSPSPVILSSRANSPGRLPTLALILTLSPDVQAEDRATATRRPQEPEQGPYRGGLARPVGPEETEDLPFLHGEIHILYAPRFAAVGLGKLLGLYRQAHQFLLSYRGRGASLLALSVR